MYFLKRGHIITMEKQQLSKRVGKNLKILIKNSKFKTQDKFANEGMHVDPVTVRRWIANGIRDVNTIYEISEILEVSFMDFFKE